MATSPATIAHILDTLPDLNLSAKKMFGEYGLYLDARIVALICDDTLFAKPTASAHPLIPDVAMGPPYPGARDHMILNELLDDPDLCTRVLRAVASDVPEPKPKTTKPKTTKPKSAKPKAAKPKTGKPKTAKPKAAKPPKT